MGVLTEIGHSRAASPWLLRGGLGRINLAVTEFRVLSKTIK